MTDRLCGWILDIYADESDGAVVWLLGEDGQRYRLTDPFKTTFYISGQKRHLTAIREQLSQKKDAPRTAFVQRRELFRGIIEVLAIQTENPIEQEKLFFRMQRIYRNIQYFDAKIPFALRYCTARNIFPAAHCECEVDEHLVIQSIRALEDRWGHHYKLPPLRMLYIEPDHDPLHTAPTLLKIITEKAYWELSLAQPIELLREFQNILAEHDPDAILTVWGDSWLFPTLFQIAEEHRIDFNPNRDRTRQPRAIQAMTFASYGTVHHRSAQTHLFGRWHIDSENSSMDMGDKFSIVSAIEMARVTSVSVQVAARNSPGSGFTAMQMRAALHRGVLVPLHKWQIEKYKSALQLNQADCGGLNYRPIIGVHQNVAEIDFFSMYPSIMMRWNISGETVGVAGERNYYVPGTGAPINQDEPGLVAELLRPMLYKRLAVKRALRKLDPDSPKYRTLQSIASALKWLGLVGFGYSGYKNNLFGNIAAHEAITAVGRETLITGIEVAHEMGFEVLAANVDSLFVQKPDCSQPEDFKPLVDEIFFRTGLIIELEGIYSWIAFQPAIQNPFVGAANRYFGKFLDGSLKVRGMAQRRSDTPGWIVNAEKDLMGLLTEVDDITKPEEYLQHAVGIVKRYWGELDAGRVPIEDLVCKTRLSRKPEEYKGNSVSAKAARQLAAAGKDVQVGQRVKFIYTFGKKTEIMAWDLPLTPDESHVNKSRYKELLLRTAHQVLNPFGISEDDLASLVGSNLRQLELWPDEDEWEILEEEEELSLADVLFLPYR